MDYDDNLGWKGVSADGFEYTRGLYGSSFKDTVDNDIAVESVTRQDYLMAQINPIFLISEGLR